MKCSHFFKLQLPVSAANRPSDVSQWPGFLFLSYRQFLCKRRFCSFCSLFFVKTQVYPIISGGRASISYIFNEYQASFVNSIIRAYFDHIFSFCETVLAKLALMIISPFIFIMQRHRRYVLFCLLGVLEVLFYFGMRFFSETFGRHPFA